MIEGTLVLICQTIILAYGHHCLITTAHATIHAHEKAVVFVDTRVPETTAVYSLHEHTPHDVLVELKELEPGLAVHIAPARAIFITDKEVEHFDDIPGKLDFVQYFSPRKVSAHIWMTNFVLTTLLGSEPEFRKLLNSEDKAEQKILDAILKTAVMLHHDVPVGLPDDLKNKIGEHGSL